MKLSFVFLPLFLAVSRGEAEHATSLRKESKEQSIELHSKRLDALEVLFSKQQQELGAAKKELGAAKEELGAAKEELGAANRLLLEQQEVSNGRFLSIQTDIKNMIHKEIEAEHVPPEVFEEFQAEMAAMDEEGASDLEGTGDSEDDAGNGRALEHGGRQLFLHSNDWCLNFVLRSSPTGWIIPHLRKNCDLCPNGYRKVGHSDTNSFVKIEPDKKKTLYVSFWERCV